MNLSAILIVDDEPEFVSPLVRRLRKRGFDCQGVLDGVSALAALRENSFAVVLLDMRLPDLDGVSVLREIKKNWPATEVLILSGHASIRDGEEGLRQGASDYLIKPVEFETLLEKIRAANVGSPAGLLTQDNNINVLPNT